jgi:hypothetical protein
MLLLSESGEIVHIRELEMTGEIVKSYGDGFFPNEKKRFIPTQMYFMKKNYHLIEQTSLGLGKTPKVFRNGFATTRDAGNFLSEKIIAYQPGTVTG